MPQNFTGGPSGAGPGGGGGTADTRPITLANIRAAKVILVFFMAMQIRFDVPSFPRRGVDVSDGKNLWGGWGHRPLLRSQG